MDCKGGGLAVDISRGTRRYWVRRVQLHKEALGRASASMLGKKQVHEYNHEDCEDRCFDYYWELSDETLGLKNLDVAVSFDEGIMYPE